MSGKKILIDAIESNECVNISVEDARELLRLIDGNTIWDQLSSVQSDEDISMPVHHIHRTHQANIIRNISKILDSYSVAPFDLRNEAAVNYAKIVSTETKSMAIPHI